MEKTFGQRLKEIRRAKSISQRLLAEKVGVDFSYISKIENDRLPPPAAATIERICGVLKIPNEELMTGSGKMSEDLKEFITSTPEAMRLLSELRTKKLKTDQWDFLNRQIKKMK